MKYLKIFHRDFVIYKAALFTITDVSNPETALLTADGY